MLRRKATRPTGVGLVAVLAVFTVLATFAGAAEDVLVPETSPGVPPVTRTVSAADTMHGVVVADPYRWLEDFTSDEAQDWLHGQEGYLRSVLDEWPGRDELRTRLDELFHIGGFGYTSLRGERLFFTRREGSEEQAVLYFLDTPDGEPVELIDPMKLADDDPVGLDWWYPSYDGRLLVYGTSESGSEMSTLRVMNVDTQELMPDTITEARAASVAWEPDGTGFYYTRFPHPGEVPENERYYHRKVYHHEIGRADDAEDALVFEDEDPYAWTGVSLSRDGRFLLAYSFRGSSRNDLFVQDLEGDWGFLPIAEGIEARFSGVPVGDTLFMQTTHEAPRGRIMRVHLEHPQPANWEELIPESESAITSFGIAGGRIFVHYLENAHSVLRIFDLDGAPLGEVPLPGISTVFDWSGDLESRELYVGVHSFLMPPTIFRYEMDTGGMEEYMTVEAPVDIEPFETEQVWYESKDGTPVSMFLVHRKDVELDGDNPTILTGYGGFSSPITPGFSRNWFLWMERGGVFATPNLRGGNEYGEEWHRAGMLENKQNSYDDFIAAAEWLIDEGYTRPSRLAVWGGSNGGLLVGAFVTQRPDLARIAICDVPLLDMVRFNRFYIANTWTAEYGSPEDPEQFGWLYAYSPYHNVDPEASYPAVLFTTAESDTRVHPSHAMKMTALLQSLDTFAPRERPVLLMYERKAGHGAGLRMSSLLERYVDNYSFLMRQMELGK